MNHPDDKVKRLLHDVAQGKITPEAARELLQDVEIGEQEYLSAVEHGVFNEVEPGTVVRASLAPSGASGLIILTFIWGLFWVVWWTGSTAYGLYHGWDQQNLAYQIAMTLLTLIIMGIVYMRFVMPDIVIVKNRRNKYITSKDPESWKEYKI